MKTYANGILVLILVLTHLSFTACMKSKKTVRIFPDSSIHVEKATAGKSSADQEEARRTPKKNESGESVTIPGKEKMKDSDEGNETSMSIEGRNNRNRQDVNQHPSKDTDIIHKITTTPHIDKTQSKLRFTARRKNIILDAGESHEIVVYLENQGNVKEENVKIKIEGFEGKGILKSNEKLSKMIDVILPGQKETVIFPVEINSEIEDITLLLKISIVNGKSAKPSVRKITVTSRSKEKRLYDEIKKNRGIYWKNRIKKGEEYIERYENGRYITDVKNIIERLRTNIENLRWKKVQEVYGEAERTMNVEQEKIDEIESIYLSHYGLEGRYSEDAARVFNKMQDFKAICARDTYEAYQKFKEKYKEGPFTQIAQNRTKLEYWLHKEKEDPNNSHIWCQVAHALMEAKGESGYQEAKEYFMRTINADKNNEMAYIGLGAILTYWKNYNRCINHLENQRPKEVENHEIYYFLGNAYDRQGNKNRSLLYYTKAIENIENKIKREINHIKQKKYLQSNDKKQAIVKIKKNPVYLKYLYYRALIYRMIPVFDKAINDFLKIIKIDPESKWAGHARDYLKGME